MARGKGRTDAVGLRRRLVPVVALGVTDWIGLALLDSAAIGLFVSRAGAAAVPIAYVAGGLLTISAGLLTTRRRDGPAGQLRTMRGIATGTAVVTAAIGLGLLLTGAVVFVFAAMAGTESRRPSCRCRSGTSPVDASRSPRASAFRGRRLDPLDRPDLGVRGGPGARNSS